MPSEGRQAAKAGPIQAIRFSHREWCATSGSRRRDANSGATVMAKKKRHSAAEIAAKLQQAGALAAEGRTQSEIAQALGISVMTFHRWRKARSQRPASIASSPAEQPTTSTGDLSEAERQNRIAELELENTRLRMLVTDLLLEKTRLEEEVRRFASPGARKKTLR
jgi:putative transposase